MGCFWGVFYPNENYASILAVIREYSRCCALDFGPRQKIYGEVWQKVEALNLSVKPENGEAFEPIGGVSLIDYAEELDEDSARELSVLGLPRDSVTKYFREADERYWNPRSD